MDRFPILMTDCLASGILTKYTADFSGADGNERVGITTSFGAHFSLRPARAFSTLAWSMSPTIRKLATDGEIYLS